MALLNILDVWKSEEMREAREMRKSVHFEDKNEESVRPERVEGQALELRSCSKSWKLWSMPEEEIDVKVRSAAASARVGRVEGQALDPRSRRVSRMARAMPGDGDRVAVRSLAALGLDCPLENLQSSKHTIICSV